jgi:hypothetical protein
VADVSRVVKGIAIAVAIGLTAGFAAFAFPALLAVPGLTTLVTSLMTSAVLSGVAAQLTSAKRPPIPSQTITYAGTVEPRRIIYGETRVGGMEVIPPVTSGTNNQMLHQVVAIAGHEVNAISTVFFGQDQVGAIAAVTGTSGDGLVTSGTFANRAWVRRYLGTATQTVDFILDTALGIWTTDHRGRGIAYCAIQYQFDDAIYKTGKPPVSFQVQGKKVYDPRLDDTNGGSGSHLLATPSTWAYSNNPALCLADYLTDATLGLGEEQSRIDWAMVAVAAAECDEMVAIPSSTQKRYTFNGVLYATSPYEDNITAIAGAMLGGCIYSGGRWRIWAGSWPLTTEFTIDASTFADEGAEFYDAIPYNERYNSVRGSFIDPTNNYQPNEFPAVSNASYVTADGEQVFRDVRFEHCTDAFEAQRLAIYLTRKSRNRQSAVLRCNLRAFRIRPGEVGLCTLAEVGWVNQLVRCEEWSFNAAGWVEIKVVEENSSDWADPATGDYLTPLAISNPAPVDFTPDPVSALTATPTQNGVQLTWALPTLFPSGAVVEVFEHTAITPFSSAVKIGETQGTSLVVGRTDTGVRYYWARVKMLTGALSTVFPVTNGVSSSIASQLDFAFSTSGNVVAVDSGAVKSGGSAAWDSQMRSLQGYRGGAFVGYRPTQTDADYMIGLNSDPATDADYTSIDYALQATSITTIQIFESGSFIGSFGSYAAGDDLSVVYDGAVVRYLKNGTVLREAMAGTDRTFYLDSSFYSPGAFASNIRFGPYTGFLPEPFLARGNCQVTANNMFKNGGSAAWDSDVVSVRGYSNCFLTFKPSQTNCAIMVGLNTDPLTNASFASIDYAFYLRSDGQLELYEAGSAVLFVGAYAASSVLSMTYDGGSIRYYMDGVLLRTQTPGAGVYYFDSSFNTLGGGINSVRFGPGLNVPVVDTSQIRDDATSTVATLYDAPADARQAVAGGGLLSVDVESLAVTTTGKAVAVDLSTTIEVFGTASGYSVMDVQIYCDGSPLSSAKWDAVGLGIAVGYSQQLTLSALHVPAAGAHTYSMRFNVEVSGGSGNWGIEFKDRFLKVREYKK